MLFVMKIRQTLTIKNLKICTKISHFFKKKKKEKNKIKIRKKKSLGIKFRFSAPKNQVELTMQQFFC